MFIKVFFRGSGMVWGDVVLWQKIALYGFILLGLFIYVKVTRLSIRGVPLIRLPYRIGIALLFPLLFVLMFVFGAFLLALVLVILLVVFLLSLFGFGKIKIKRIRL
jgi:hypothetical protein